MTSEAESLFHNDCPKVSRVLSRLGDKWSVLIVVLLRERAFRFNEIKRAVSGISQQMLTRTLRNLERDGLVSRTTYPTSPPQVEYALTDLGRSLSEPVLALGDWARANLAAIDAAQARYDRTAQK
ncbi:winged helix-turn-helix transcriptional regulator [Hyphococcus sp.]|jgi:DNA-binding HxlR family transcriptional regulator|uniref:winged helix-turn-helix transcriptional regulator n=1 Tax=Hyphococcus sp. TaxID=2038636 RepID=UPI003D0BCFED